MASSIIDIEEKRFEKLPAEELGRQIMQLPIRRRVDLILHRADADRVVAAMPDQDFFLTVKEIGPDDSLPLLALARVGQISHLFDLEWWQKDRIEPARALEWLQRLASAGEDKFLAWLYEADFDLLVALMKQWISLAVAPEDVDLAEAREQLPVHTLDDHYFWEPRYPQYEEFFKAFLGTLFEVSYGFYKELMNSILYALDVEVEEQAYRLHRARLEDRAIPDYYDALEIYKDIRPDEITPTKARIAAEGSEVAPPSFAVALLPEGDLLSRVLRKIDDPAMMDTFQFELAALANKVVVADGLEPDSAESLHLAVAKTAAYVNLGLALKSSDRLEAALSIVQEVFLEDLFRLGQTQVGKLRGRLQQVVRHGWLSQWPAGLACLEPDWMEQAELLLARTPKLLRHQPGEDKHVPAPVEDFFRSREDLFRGKHFIDVLITLGDLFEALKPSSEELAAVLWKDGQIRTVADITLGALIITAAGRYELTQEWSPEPIPVRDWPALFPMAQPDRLEKLVHAWVEQVAPEAGHRSLIEAYLTPLLYAYRNEMAPFDALDPPDPGLVRFFMFRAAGKG